jgi:Occlusion-derived virus envelope protein E25
MIATIILILVVLAVLYFLYSNDKLNFNSLNESSPSFGQSSDSLQTNDMGQLTVKFNTARIKTLRVLHGDNKLSRVCAAERPLSYSEIVDEGNRSVGTNCVFLGAIAEPAQTATLSQPGTSANSATRISPNFDIKQFKNLFIVFKGVDSSKIKESGNMVRYESDGMVYCLIDSTTTAVPDLREVSYPIVVFTTNPHVQLKLKEWDYVQVNDSGTLFLKNEKSFRIQ